MKLLVAIDFSDPTDLIFRVAKRLATGLGASVWIVHAAGFRRLRRGPRGGAGTGGQGAA